MTRARVVGLVVLLVAAVVAAALILDGAWRSSEPTDDPPAAQAGGGGERPTSTDPTLVGSPGADGVGDPYYPWLGNGGYDVDRYELDLEWRPDDATLAGTATVSARATQDLSRFNLDLAGLRVESVVVEGEAAGFRQVDRELEITPVEPIAAGTAFTAVVTYGGVPRPVSDGTDLFDVGWQTDGREAFVVAEPGGASTFYPANDHPSDKATYRFEITAPTDQVVAANGLLAGTRDAAGGRRTWTYEARDPMASYLVQVAIGDLELVDGGRVGEVAIRHALHRSVADAARSTLARTGEMIDLLDDVFGPYPFEAYGVVVVDEPLGFALETQTLTIIGDDLAVRGAGAERILLHELAHQWVGNSVSAATWRDIWLNEGFATYAEWIWIERTGGRSAASSARAAAGGRGLATPPGDPGPDELFSPTVYRRGAMTLQALRETVGDEAFFTVLRRWATDRAGGVASTDDLIALAEEVAARPLRDLFTRWLYTPGLPAL